MIRKRTTPNIMVCADVATLERLVVCCAYHLVMQRKAEQQRGPGGRIYIYFFKSLDLTASV